jgi:hypothetical protein
MVGLLHPSGREGRSENVALASTGDDFIAVASFLLILVSLVNGGIASLDTIE